MAFQGTFRCIGFTELTVDDSSLDRSDSAAGTESVSERIAVLIPE